MVNNTTKYGSSQSSSAPIRQAKESIESGSDERLTVYAVTLEDDGSPSKAKTLLRLPPPAAPYILRIYIEAGTSASRNGSLYTNFPIDGSQYERTKLHQTKLPQDFSKPFGIDLEIATAGAFEYHVEYDGDAGRVKAESGYFIVEPLLTISARSSILSKELTVLPPGKGGVISKEEVHLPLDGLVIQSIVSKFMGTLEDWVPHLDVMRDRGYNLLHYIPLQQRGKSDSPYSIYDQLELADDLFVAKGLTREQKNQEMSQWLGRIKSEWGILGMIDVVLNHTANNSPWLEEHPEAGFNAVNSPHLEAAVELDTALITFSESLERRGLPTELKSAGDLDAIMVVLEGEMLPSLKLHEYYAINVEREVAAFTSAWSASKAGSNATSSHLGEMPPKKLAENFIKKCLPKNWNQLGPRYHVKVDQDASITFIAALTGAKPGSDTAEQASKELQRVLDIINVSRYEQYDDDRKAILTNTRSRIRYTRIDADGPKYGKISNKSPLVEPLFTRLPKSKATDKHDPKSLALANNGWIWDADPLQNFAGPESRTYIRRDLIVWGDCVKLNYSSGPEDNPWLWKHMTEYSETLASLFHGFRLDNAHSTPIHVGEYLLDAARRVNPNLYVCAELFTGSQELDLHFVCRLGLSSLTREAMNSNNPKEESGLLYSYGLGKPIGSMDGGCLTVQSEVEYKGKTRKCSIVPLAGSVPHAFLMDCTHDNEMPLSKRTAEDALPTGALVTFARAAIGSTRGFDDLYPDHLDVVTDSRHYELAGSDAGIGHIKRVLNHLHAETVLDEAVEGHFSQEGDYITCHRVNPVTHKGYLLITRTAFFKSHDKSRGYVSPTRLDGTNVKYITGATINIKSEKPRDTETTLRGLDAEVTEIKDVPVASKRNEATGHSYSEIVVPDTFPPGSVLLFATWMEGLPADLDEQCAAGVIEAFDELDLVDLNSVLYRADGEERDAVGGDGVYAVPGMAPLVYCGLQGWMHPLNHIMATNDLGHPLCAHLRQGTWALDYVHARLEKQVDQLPRLAKPAAWFKERFKLIKKVVPPFLVPKYFALVINVAYKAARDRAMAQFSPLVREGTSFTAALALTSVQMLGQVRSASLNPFKTTPSLAAGLPHFTAGWARTWGRDVFISLRGLFLVTGQFAEAREHILAFSSVVKHGLVPNLLDSGKTPRYNCRDGPWFMLQNIQDYVEMAPNGLDLLKDTVKRRFPLDDTWVPHYDARAYAVESTIADVVQEILQRHAQGIHFREYNAGPNLDMQMSDQGFNIDIDVDWKTGILYGGNAFNCGTWQDKMGESAKAGNKGLPGTPRDGAPVEIIGLLKSALRWVAELSKAGKFPHKGVEATIDGKKRVVAYSEWADLIQFNFERLFYVPANASDDSKYAIKTDLVGRRGIYKDVVGSTGERFDYQLRGNFPIAMTVAPELFDREHALGALKIAEKVLLGPLGVKTLDPSDPDYRGYYDNSNDGDDRSIAKGWNYHQGPEWVWPIGFFLRAYLIYDTQVGEGKQDPKLTYHHIYQILAKHRQHIRDDAWAGLPELTNEGGNYCHDSCRTQAWSTSTILDVLDDIRRR
ncbi:amylo-1,6-glucosidase [Microbotryum lychnidis-dioicae p1A1 Lamole]|uniref:Glycogen debranching enzyme n=1 Tax=Microbotryum lychnidis-dioicae (strain p1A1 Lamole / MvSl-1064) TaxID=683840 RepID=U5H663_USTV1|nr:amylo-1,6-glucosidase [Microbotryum lychnidis-dioicae p1A1 Lamole]|eukprot:KDE06879.1 amylo-1,6-glucosidase [Microbotryum lychnidis-dioicae p1A1 Lamole]